MKGLAWDDVPNDLVGLQRELRAWGVDLVIESKPNAFARQLLQGQWDFVVTDLIDNVTASTDIRDAVGVRNAREASTRASTVFILTGFRQQIDLRTFNLPTNVILKSKDLPVAWLAGEICQTLKDRGLFVDQKRVFLISGSDSKADEATGLIRGHLENMGLTVLTGHSGTVDSTIPQDVLNLMQPCAAFVAVCTPDEVAAGGVRVPRGNVLFEIGMAVGLARGLDRLIILQKWGPSPEEQTQLPSDFSGSVTIRLETSFENTLTYLDQRLRRLGIAEDI